MGSVAALQTSIAMSAKANIIVAQKSVVNDPNGMFCV